MRIKNFLLGVSLAMCGAAFGQVEAANYQVYVPDLNKTYFAKDLNITESEDEDTRVELIDIVDEVGGDSGGSYDYVVPGTKVPNGNNPYVPFYCTMGVSICVYVLDLTD